MLHLWPVVSFPRDIWRPKRALKRQDIWTWLEIDRLSHSAATPFIKGQSACRNFEKWLRHAAISVADDRLTKWTPEFKVPKVFVHNGPNIPTYVVFIIVILLSVERVKQFDFATAVSSCIFATLPFKVSICIKLSKSFELPCLQF